jgi:hypothetical protein
MLAARPAESTLLRLLNITEEPSSPGDVQIRSNRFTRNTAGGPSAGGCAAGLQQHAWGGAVDVVADVADFVSNVFEAFDACSFGGAVRAMIYGNMSSSGDTFRRNRAGLVEVCG